MKVDEIDLANVCALLDRALGGQGAEGYVRGRTVLRDGLITVLGCSASEAEDLVETLIARGFLRFTGDPTTAAQEGGWLIDVAAANGSPG